MILQGNYFMVLFDPCETFSPVPLPGNSLSSALYTHPLLQTNQINHSFSTDIVSFQDSLTHQLVSDPLCHELLFILVLSRLQ